jgi:hypothetical protein
MMAVAGAGRDPDYRLGPTLSTASGKPGLATRMGVYGMRKTTRRTIFSKGSVRVAGDGARRGIGSGIRDRAVGGGVVGRAIIGTHHPTTGTETGIVLRHLLLVAVVDLPYHRLLDLVVHPRRPPVAPPATVGDRPRHHCLDLGASWTVSNLARRRGKSLSNRVGRDSAVAVAAAATVACYPSGSTLNRDLKIPPRPIGKLYRTRARRRRDGRCPIPQRARITTGEEEEEEEGQSRSGESTSDGQQQRTVVVDSHRLHRRSRHRQRHVLLGAGGKGVIFKRVVFLFLSLSICHEHTQWSIMECEVV